MLSSGFLKITRVSRDVPEKKTGDKKRTWGWLMRYFLRHCGCLDGLKGYFYQEWDAYLKEIEQEWTAKQYSWHVEEYESAVTGLTIRRGARWKRSKGFMASFATRLVQKQRLCLRLDVLPLLESRMAWIQPLAEIVSDYAYLL